MDALEVNSIIVLLEDLVPPADFSPAESSPSELSSCPGEVGFSVARLLQLPLSSTIGRILGGRDDATVARWEYLADDPAARAVICSSVYLHHVHPLVAHIPDERARAAAANELGGRLLSPFGSKGLLSDVGTPRWRMCVALAQHLASDCDEEGAGVERYERQDAWAAANAFEAPGIATLLLYQAAVLLGGVDLFDGVTSGLKAVLSMDARRAHLRVPPAARHGETLRGLLHPLIGAASSEGDSSGSSQLSGASTTAAVVLSFDEIVRGIVFTAEGECTLDDVRDRLAELGVAEASVGDVKKARSKGLRHWARLLAGGRVTAEVTAEVTAAVIRHEPPPVAPSPVERQAHADAVEAFTSNMAVWMHANGVRNPSAAEIVRLRRLSDRLRRQTASRDLEGAVATWLEVQLGAGARPPRPPRRQATARMRAWLAQGLTSTDLAG